MKTTQHVKNGTTVLEITGPIHPERVSELQKELLGCLNGPSGITLTFNHTEAWDAVLIQLIVSAQKTATGSGQSFSITDSSGSFQKAAEQIGLHSLF